jgi:6-phosphogluconolactonase (cycloisomerase 2 family)
VTVVATLSCSTALGQANQRAAFIANNGNLEGSVTSFVFDANDAPVFADKLITGTRPTTNDYEPGSNAYSISMTPSGRYLAVGHASSNDPFQQITILEVASDAALTLVGEYMTPDTPLDVVWLSNQYLAATRTEVGLQNQVLVYEFDPNAVTLTQIDAENTGTFTGSLALRPGGAVLYAGDSFVNQIYVFTVNGDGTLTPLQTIGSPGYPLGIHVTPDGSRLYAFGGISLGGSAILGWNIGLGGSLSAIPGMPFTSPGASPKDCTFSPDSARMYVAHGTDATVRSFSINAVSGVVTSLGHSFDVGLQGSLSDVKMLGDVLLVDDNTTSIDGVRGLYSFDTFANGGLAMNGGIVDTQGVSPNEIATWAPANCAGDVNGDGAVNISDLGELLVAFGTCNGDPGFNAEADLTGDGCVNISDLGEVLAAFGGVCM